MSKSRFIMMLMCIAAATIALFVQPSMAVPPSPKDALTVTAKTSGNGNNPDEIGSNWVYAYTLTCNSSFSDTLHVELMVSNMNTAGDSYTIGFTKSGSTELSGTATSLPANFTLADDGTTVTKNISIASGSLAPGDYTLNINITYPNNEVTAGNPNSIQVKIHVNECDDPSGPTCFFTDSSGDFLVDCQGALVSTDSGGTFMLIDKKNGTIVATNPGQFYYNYIWTNDGPAVDVQIQLSGLLNLVPQGANALHAYTFDTSGFTQDVDSFNMVNNDGTPCGPAGPCTINVGEGETLWVTWHLAYGWIGSVKPGAGDSCPGSEPIGAAASLVDASNTATVVAGACSASAAGNNKR